MNRSTHANAFCERDRRENSTARVPCGGGQDVSGIRSPFVDRGLAELNGENSRADVQNVREESSAARLALCCEPRGVGRDMPVGQLLVSLSTCRSRINCFHGKEIKPEF